MNNRRSAGITLRHQGSGIGPELGQATGDIQRHRAFYVVDRSILVAYVPGQFVGDVCQVGLSDQAKLR